MLFQPKEKGPTFSSQPLESNQDTPSEFIDNLIAQSKQRQKRLRDQMKVPLVIAAIIGVSYMVVAFIRPVTLDYGWIVLLSMSPFLAWIFILTNKDMKEMDWQDNQKNKES
jgi:hypothetical protein